VIDRTTDSKIRTSAAIRVGPVQLTPSLSRFQRYGFFFGGGFVGKSPALQKVLEQIDLVAT
jgi:hypothetical protein